MKDAGINVTEMNSGCICCSLVGDFGAALEEVLENIIRTALLLSHPVLVNCRMLLRLSPV